MPKSLVSQGFFGFSGLFFDLLFFATFSEPSGLEPAIYQRIVDFSFLIGRCTKAFIYDII